MRRLREPPPRGSETVLIVEDQDAVRTLTRRILERQGYRVIEARTGAEALRVFEERQAEIDLVVSDVIMPEMGGRELVAKLGAVRRGVRVLLMSGFVDDAQLPSVEGESVAFLPKPFAPDVLLAKVREVLDR